MNARSVPPGGDRLPLVMEISDHTIDAFTDALYRFVADMIHAFDGSQAHYESVMLKFSASMRNLRDRVESRDVSRGVLSTSGISDPLRTVAVNAGGVHDFSPSVCPQCGGEKAGAHSPAPAQHTEGENRRRGDHQ